MAQAKAKEAEIQDKQDVVDDGRSTMYQNPYRKDLDKEVEDPRQAVEDTPEATPQETGFINSNETQPNHDYKKRYDDLKTHYDRKQNESKQKTEELEAKIRLAEKNQAMANYTPPKTDDELKSFKEKYPDVYDVIKTVAQKEADDKAKALADKLSKLEVDQQTVAKQKAEVELLQLHPDFNKIRESQDFHDWASVQDSVIQGWLYDNFNNSQLASRAIDLYKMDRGLKKSDAKKESAKEASKSVTSTNRGSEKDVKGKKVWSLTEISKLKPNQYAKFEKDIDLARAEGRITN